MSCSNENDFEEEENSDQYDIEDNFSTIQSMFEQALVSKNIEKDFQNVIDLSENLEKGKYWKYMSYEELTIYFFKQKIIDKFFKYFEKLFECNLTIDYFNKNSSLKKIFTYLKIYSLNELTNLINNCFQILRRINHTKIIMEIFEILKEKKYHYEFIKDTIFFYIIKPKNVYLPKFYYNESDVNISLKIEKIQIIHINNRNMLYKGLFDFDSNKLIFFLGEIYAIFFRNFITFYSLDSKQISKFHEINMILFCQLIDKNFGFYSVKNGIVFFDLEKVEKKFLLLFSIIHIQLTNDKRIFCLNYGFSKYVLNILSQSSNNNYQIQIKIELSVYGKMINESDNENFSYYKYFDLFHDKIFSENNEETYIMSITDNKILSFNNFKFIELDDYYVLKIGIKFIILNKIFFITKKLIYKEIKNIYGGKNNTLIEINQPGIFLIYKCPEFNLIQKISYKSLQYSLDYSKIKDEDLTEIQKTFDQKQKYIYIKNKNIVNLFYVELNKNQYFRINKFDINLK